MDEVGAQNTGPQGQCRHGGQPPGVKVKCEDVPAARSRTKVKATLKMMLKAPMVILGHITIDKYSNNAKCLARKCQVSIFKS